LIKALLERGEAGVGLVGSVGFAEFSVGWVTRMFQILVVDVGSAVMRAAVRP
jgi:hypothetical protein